MKYFFPGFCLNRKATQIRKCSILFVLLLGIVDMSFGQLNRNVQESSTSLAKIEEPPIKVRTNNFRLELLPSSQTLTQLFCQHDTLMNFVPDGNYGGKMHKGLYRLGDINLGLRPADSAKWHFYSSARNRQPVVALDAKNNVIAAAELANCFPEDMPLDVKRYWVREGCSFSLRFLLRNKSNKPVEIGYLGIPMIFNNVLIGEDLETAYKKNVFYDPYIGMDGGYLQVAGLNGSGPALLVLPEAHTPFEAYNPLLDDPTPRGSDFEGFYEWVVCSQALAETKWKNAKPWNKATSFVLQPGQSRMIGVHFVLSPSIRKIEQTLTQYHRPVAVGIPGYVLPKDVDGSLFLKYNHKISSIEVEPSNALSVSKGKMLENGWDKFVLKGNHYGRARVTVRYADGTLQTIQYKVIEPESQTISNYGHFLNTKQWFDKPDSIFHRSPSFISYDNELHKQITQNNRAWIAGLSDEGGAGSWLGMIMKQLVIPDKNEINHIQRFVDSTLWGGIQYKSGALKYGVRKSLFFYAPDSFPKKTYNSDIDFHTWSAWPEKEAASVGRSYNYPHVAAAYWVMYRLARYHQGLVTNHQWHWYLEQAFHTSLAMVNLAPYYTQFGQMEGTVFYLILKDLKREGLEEEANQLEMTMKKRAIHWSELAFPFGSEMPWDSTGQEEVFIWSLYFGYMSRASTTINAILGYMPTIPSWAYNGNARRYWDFLYAGKLQRIERMIHHYGSELNAIPLLTWYRLHPADLYLLRVGYGGLLGGIANIEKDGFAPLAFHAFPNTLKADAYSGDYGSGFFGYAVNSATYLVHHPEFGWLAFGGNIQQDDNWINVAITTASQSSVFIAPEHLWITLNAGKIKRIAYNDKTGEIKLMLEPMDNYTKYAVLNITNPSGATSGYHTNGIKALGNMYKFKLDSKSITITLNKNSVH